VMREVEATNQSISANSPTHSRRCQKRYCARTAIGMYLGIIVATVENGKTVEQSGWEAASVSQRSLKRACRGGCLPGRSRG
ncbi:MAG: hypothetical protein ACXWNN_05830, partial [Candidatus Binataceae bacterium]